MKNCTKLNLSSRKTSHSAIALQMLNRLVSLDITSASKSLCTSSPRMLDASKLIKSFKFMSLSFCKHSIWACQWEETSSLEPVCSPLKTQSTWTSAGPIPGTTSFNVWINACLSKSPIFPWCSTIESKASWCSVTKAGSADETTMLNFAAKSDHLDWEGTWTVPLVWTRSSREGKGRSSFNLFLRNRTEKKILQILTAKKVCTGQSQWCCSVLSA